MLIALQGKVSAQITDDEDLLDSVFMSNEKESDAQKAAPRLSLEGSIRKTQDYTLKINELNKILKSELDTVQISEVISLSEGLVSIVERRLVSEETKINLRYLSALDNLISSINSRITTIEETVRSRVDNLAAVKTKIDSIKQDDLMRYSLRDTTLLPEYQSAISNLRTILARTDSLLSFQRLQALTFQSRISNITVKVNEIRDNLDFQKQGLERALFNKENNFIWEPKDFPNTESLVDIFRTSINLNQTIVSRYIRNHLGISIFLVLLVFLINYWAGANLKKIKSEKEFSGIILGRMRYLPSYPFLSSLMVILAIAPFFYPNPPVSFFSLVLIVMVSISGILLRRRIGKELYQVWWMLFFLFIISTASNLYWEIAYQERWHLLAFNVFGIFLGLRLLKLQKANEKLDIPPYVRLFARIYVSFGAVSIIANILGRFSLSKMIGITATLSLMHALALVIFVIIIKELIYLQLEVSRKSESDFTSMIDFNDIQKKVNKMFSFLAFAIWGYYFFESLSILDTLIQSIGEFLSKQRSILNASFNFAQIAVFFVVVYIATFLANTVAYAASIKDQQNVGLGNKRLGSSILLMRLAVLTIGFLIAVAASGIPVDKIAIVLGALSVGIGFGLQTIVNNLVSGVILAFEKPIQIGDTVEVGGVEGIVKDIGIRASKIKNWDGAEVIIPNGDLLAQQLTNWTLSDKKRRVELIIGVAYKSDMDLVTELIANELAKDEILKSPEPRVFLQTFADNSVNFRVLFWVNDVDIWIMIRDQVMRGIFKAFKNNDIEIPFPQRDLYVKDYPGLVQEKLMKPGEEEK
ncbi:mechanosensitive ion channel domain-containing protein [Aquiflexum lacus]|uniref:mechanosensitive ion channel domain-containing protein n=1 Tax=Aquiflexum lacus TaxID=2483805 RepID=UPI001E53B760|nr:mechanosensitive ion channel domain-containing protein [Aquiflexum lacus]